MKLYIIRHGKTQWNLEGRFQGASGDSPLLEEAYDDIKQLGQRLARVSFDALYSSDLKRAVDTSKALLEQIQAPKEIVYTQELREWRLGQLEGAKIATMTAIYPRQMNAFSHNLDLFNTNQFGAESLYQTQKRVTDLITRFKEKDYKNVIIVGHGANLTASIRSLLGYTPALIRAEGGLDNASLTLLETDDCVHFKCLTWNDKSYLTGNNQ
ncbi:histidine phosphatase family protein [Streptococcus iniae]|uniref:histidine phosphatase family protein n=1 Tax=Streptococcus iniae TaxID=1346 RepID=UPI000EF6E9C2|nr:histidine phosphatase family protein [Streptococcus iniae]RLU53266.1 histidine phosphatase family protein [Streptococcus iniae]